jgi:hypothetical protein
MIKFLSVLGVLLVSLTSGGLDRSDWVVAEKSERNLIVVLVRTPDYVSIPVCISTWKVNKKISASAKEKSVKAIVSEAEKHPDITALRDPPARSSASPANVSKKSSKRQCKPDLYVMVQCREKGRGVSECRSMMRKFLRGVTLPDKTRLRFCGMQLIAANPEKYRPRILEMISQHLLKTRESIAHGEVGVKGLEKPVRVRKADGGMIEFFIDYEIVANM